MAETTSRVRLVFDGSERGVTAAAARAAAAIKSLSGATSKSEKDLNAFSAAMQTLQRRTILWGSIATAALPAVGQAIAAVAPAMVALGAAGATVALGFDGVKKAAEQLKKPFEDLKTSISGTFARELTPAFERLKPVISGLDRPLNEMAKNISAVAASMIDLVASKSGMDRLAASLKGANEFVKALGPGVVSLTDMFLTLTSVGASQMDELGRAISGVFEDLNLSIRQLASDKSLERAFAGFIATVRGLGDVLAPTIELVVRLGAAMGDSIGTTLTNIGRAIAVASPGFVELGAAIGELLVAAGPLIPVIGQLAGEIASGLASAIRTVTPLVGAFADFMNRNRDTIAALGPVIGALIGAFLGMKVITTVTGWVAGVAAEIVGLGGKADTAGGKVGVFGGKLGLLKAVGVAAALAGVAAAIDDVNIKAAGGAENLSGFEDTLHDLRLLLNGDWGNPFDDLSQEWANFINNVKEGESTFGRVMGAIGRFVSGFKLDPIRLEADGRPAQATLSTLMRQVNTASGLVNIDGDNRPASAALQTLLQKIKSGQESVTINGETLPAQDALNLLMGIISNASGTVNIDGDDRPAGEVLAQLLRTMDNATGLPKIDANPAQANAKLKSWEGSANQTTGIPKMDANPAQANAQLAGWKGSANATVGLPKLDANRQPADAKTSGWRGDADRAVGRATLQADDGPARATLGSVIRDYASQTFTWTVNVVRGFFGLAGGGPVGFAGGGAIRGPGSGASDTAGLFRLSNGEHVLTAREVQAAGGHAAIMAFRRSLMNGRVPRMAASSGRAAAGGSVTSAGALAVPTPEVNVSVKIGDQELRDFIRTEIQTATRSTRRTVIQGAGTTF